MSDNHLSPEPQQSANAGAARQDRAAPLSCPEIDALLPAYAIGATDPPESAVISAHLRLCPTHAAELAKSETLAKALLLSTEPIQPPVRIANQLRRLINQPLTRSKSQPRAPALLPQRRGEQRWRWSTMWLAAATSLLLLVGGFNFYLVRQNLALRQAYMELAARQLAQPGQQTQQQEIYELVTTAGSQFIDLPAAQQPGEIEAEVMWNPQLKIAMLYAKAFPGLPADQVYQLWLTYNGERQSGGLFTVDGQGNGVLLFSVPHPLDQAEVIGITPEPKGGSAAPTSDPVVRRKL
jgi:anti-sigma-K factor RskA